MKHFRYRKVTPELSQQMKAQRAEGWPLHVIAQRFNISLSTVQYHLNPRYREKVLQRARARLSPPLDYDSRRKYNREYLRDRYRNDPEWRERMKAYHREYQRRRYYQKRQEAYKRGRDQNE